MLVLRSRQFVKKYGKALAASAFAVVTVVHTVVSDGHVTQQEGVQIAIAIVTAGGVYFVPILPEYPWAKSVIAVLLAALNVLTTLIVGGISPADATELVLAALTALTVGVAPARSDLTAVAASPRMRV